jgi:hypothetical protein
MSDQFFAKLCKWIDRTIPEHARAQRMLTLRTIYQLVLDDPSLADDHTFPELERMAEGVNGTLVR